MDRIRMIGKGYLYKDILRHETIRRPELVDKILRALAFQIGQEVAYTEAVCHGISPNAYAEWLLA